MKLIYKYPILLFSCILISCNFQREQTSERDKSFLRWGRLTKLDTFLNENNIRQLDSIGIEKFYLAYLPYLELTPSILMNHSDSSPDFIKGLNIQLCATMDNRPDSFAMDFGSDADTNEDSLIIQNTFVSVPIIFHYFSDKISQNLQKTFSEQEGILNSVYNTFNFTFHIEEIKRGPDKFHSINFSKKYPKEYDDLMKHCCTDTNFLHIVVTDIYYDNLQILGYANMPGNYYNAVIINPNSLPEPSIFGSHSEGKTLVHEVGHFFGLYHTFHMNERYCNKSGNCKYCDKGQYNGCDEYGHDNGDFIDDTPSQRYCNFSKCSFNNKLKLDECDSCPDEEGLDNTDNFMDYVDDQYMKKFTPGQIWVMKKNARLYRSNFIDNRLSAQSLYQEVITRLPDI